MATRYDHYLQQAEQCQAMAAQMQNPEMKEGWLKLARSWLEMLPQHSSAEVHRFDRLGDAVIPRRQ